MLVFETNRYKREDLKLLNFVQKYLRMFILADIAMFNGKKISDQSIEGIKSNCLHEDVKWPRTPLALPEKFLQLWKEALTKCFLTSYSTNKNNCTLQYTSQLGPWTTQIQWKWWKCQCNNWLYKQSSNKMGSVYTTPWPTFLCTQFYNPRRPTKSLSHLSFWERGWLSVRRCIIRVSNIASTTIPMFWFWISINMEQYSRRLQFWKFRSVNSYWYILYPKQQLQHYSWWLLPGNCQCC